MAGQVGTDIRDGLVFYMNPIESNNSSSILDLKGNIIGRKLNNPLGPISNSFQFSGSLSQSIELLSSSGSLSFISNTGSFSIITTFKTTNYLNSGSDTGVGVLAGNGVTSILRGWGLYYDNRTPGTGRNKSLVFFMLEGTLGGLVARLSGSSIVNDNNFHVVSVNGKISSVTMSLDTVSFCSGTIDTKNTLIDENNVHLGAAHIDVNNLWSPGFFDGLIGPTFIYNRPLSKDEERNVYYTIKNSNPEFNLP